MSWSDLVKHGAGFIHAVTIGGIPAVFAEAAAYRTDAAAQPAVPAPFTEGLVPALVIKDGAVVSSNIDRQTGFGSGDAFDIVLSWDGLEAAGITSKLFATPSVILKLAGDVGITTGNKPFVDTAGWTASYGYIGTERVATSVVDSDTIDFTSRGGAWSMAEVYSSSSPTFSLLSDTPMIWRGRPVMLHRHLTSAEGRVFDDTWADTASEYNRVLWRGYVDAPPRVTKEGITIRCLPLVRRASLPIGHEVAAAIYETLPGGGGSESFEDYEDALGGFPVYWAPGTPLFHWKWKSAVTVTGTVALSASHPDGVFTLDSVASSAYTGAISYVLGDMYAPIAAANSDVIALYSSVRFVGDAQMPTMRFKFQTYSTACDTGESYITVPPGAPYFMQKGTYHPVQVDGGGGGGYTINESHVYFDVPLRIHAQSLATGWYLPVVQTEGSQWTDVNLPSTGFGVVEWNDAKMAVEWDAKVEGSMVNTSIPGLVLLRIVQTLEQSAFINEWAGATLKYVSGKVGTLREVMLTMLTSSGAGNRGLYDTLGVGQGCGIEWNQIADVATFWRWGMTDHQVELYAVGSSSVEDLVGGHLALRKYCLVQGLTDPDTTATGASHPGNCQLMIVSTAAPVVDDTATVISKAEVVLEAIDAPEPAEVPNTIEVDIESLILGQEGASLIVQDVPRIQAEGPREESYAAPSMTHDEAFALATSIIAQGDGQVILTVRVAPWVEVNPGDEVRLTMAHPMLYDWTSSTRAPSTIGARCLGWEADLFSGMQRLTLLLAAAAPGVGYLCPTVEVVSKPTSTSVTVAADDVQWLDEGASVLIYIPGDENHPTTPKTAQYNITDITGVTVTFSGALASWVGSTSVITYPLIANSNTRQLRFTHNSAAYRLG